MDDTGATVTDDRVVMGELVEDEEDWYRLRRRLIDSENETRPGVLDQTKGFWNNMEDHGIRHTRIFYY